MDGPDDSAWRRPLAGALAGTAAALFWLLSVDPKGVGGGPGLFGALGTVVAGFGGLHVATAVCVAARARRAAGWLAILAGGWPLAVCAVALSLPGPAGRQARDLAAFLLFIGSWLVAPPLLALLWTEVALVELGRRALRPRPAGLAERAFALSFAAIALAAAGMGMRSWSWWHGSRERRELVAVHRAADARESLRALGHCLRRHAAVTGQGFPPALDRLDPGDESCGGAHDPAGAFPDHELHYLAAEPEADARRHRFSLVLVPRAPERRAFGRMRVDETGAEWDGVAEDGTGGDAHDDVARRIELVSLEIERSRIGSPSGAYPRSLAATGVLPANALTRRTACGRCLLEADIVTGEALGFRFLYAPTPGGAERSAGYRLDVRPARFGDPFTRSYLCTPEGLLHYTDEDRRAEPADPVLWPYEHLRDPTADQCTGRGEAEAILGHAAAR